MAKNLAELCCSVLCKVESEYLAEEIYKQSIEGAAWVLLTARSKMLEERDELKKK